MHRILLAVAAILAAVPAIAQVPTFDTATYCKDLAKGSYSTEKTCRDMEREARIALERGSVHPSIMQYCANLASGSYSTMKTCTEMETSAKENMPRVPGPTSVTRPTSPNPAGSMVIMRGGESTIEKLPDR
jgi:hypothetical protein